MHPHTSAEGVGLRAGDTITVIDDEFICGLPMQESLDMLSGPVGTSVYLMLTRVEGRVKSRHELEVMRDFDLKPMDSAKEARKKDRQAAAIAERCICRGAYSHNTSARFVAYLCRHSRDKNLISMVLRGFF